MEKESEIALLSFLFDCNALVSFRIKCAHHFVEGTARNETLGWTGSSAHRACSPYDFFVVYILLFFPFFSFFHNTSIEFFWGFVLLSVIVFTKASELLQ
jgi:hypothetical protein